jgi:hypothetical protein
MHCDIFQKYLKSPIEHKGDHHFDGETEMAISSLLNMAERIGEILEVIQTPTELPAWVQSKITIAEDYVESVSSFLKTRDMVDVIKGDI